MKRGKKNVKRKFEYKEKKSNKKLIIALTVIIILLFVLFLLIKNTVLTTKVIEKPPIISNCSNENLRKAWEFAFKGNSDNLIIIAPNQSILDEIASSNNEDFQFGHGIITLEGCPIYAIYQINGSHVKMISNLNGFFGMNLLAATSGDFPPEFIQYVQNLSGKTIDPEMSGSLEDGYSFLKRNTSISTIQEAQLYFNSIFNVSSANWASEFVDSIEILPNGTSTEETVVLYAFNESESSRNITLFGEKIDTGSIFLKVGGVDGNYSYEYYTYAEDSMIKTLEKLEKIFENWTSPINTSLSNITIQVNNSKLNLLGDYEKIQKVKISENNQPVIETEVNFTQGDFDWTKIILKKQNTNSSKGYVIINGLNYTKNITVDRLSNTSDSVCIKNKEINSIDEISTDCNLTDEYILECPGNISNFTCNIINNKFIVTGLEHSGVIEILSAPEPCTPYWECDDWTNYEKSCGYRTCTDLNNCRDELTKPNETQKCPICIPNWECTNFLPEKCPKELVRTRTCSDTNNCKTSIGEPSLKQNCTIPVNWGLIIGVILGGILILVITIILIKGSGNGKVQEENKEDTSDEDFTEEDTKKLYDKFNQDQEKFYADKKSNSKDKNKSDDEYYTPQNL